MALVKISKLDKIEIVGEFKHVQCRHATWVEDDGVMVGSKTFSRHVIAAGDDVSNEPAETQAIVAAVHTDAVIAAYVEFQATQEATSV